MVQIVLPNKKGFTLLESVIAILLLTVMMLWTMQCMISAYALSTRNQLRDEAVRLVGEQLTDARNKAFAAFSPGTTTSTVQRQIRSYDQAYTVDQVVTTEVPGIAYSVDVTAKWNFKGRNYNYSATTIIGDK